MTSQKILLSGVKPSGRPHLGNYLGAMRQFVELQGKFQSRFMIADLHALNTVQNGAELAENTLGVAMDYMAIGLSPEQSIIFKQSDVPAHTELTWVFDTLVTVPYLMRAHAFKDAEAKNKETSMGTFNYPVLMAADILLYHTDVVPVGQDQKQHIEYARDIALKFNNTYGEIFKLPDEYIQKEVAVVPGVDGQKMSKSYKNTIPLFADDDTLRKAVMSIVTDSKDVTEPKDPDTDNVFALHRFFSTEALPDLTRRYREGGIGYKESKDVLFENIRTFIAPLREKRSALEADPQRVLDALKSGGERANKIASATLAEVRKKIGTALY